MDPGLTEMRYMNGAHVIPGNRKVVHHALVFLDEEYLMGVALIGNFESPLAEGGGLLPGPDDAEGVEFLIPAGAKDHVETMQFRMPASASSSEVRLYGAGTHMHYVGKDMKVTLAREAPAAGEPAELCLVHTPRWDFS
ncbi:hypothetical protein ACMHYB_38420 [Sorangium sp. So ce1128]